jgi:hypothetical protein
MNVTLMTVEQIRTSEASITDIANVWALESVLLPNMLRDVMGTREHLVAVP